jgi:hypothetical protein
MGDTGISTGYDARPMTKPVIDRADKKHELELAKRLYAAVASMQRRVTLTTAYNWVKDKEEIDGFWIDAARMIRTLNGMSRGNSVAETLGHMMDDTVRRFVKAARRQPPS